MASMEFGMGRGRRTVIGLDEVEYSGRGMHAVGIKMIFKNCTEKVMEKVRKV